MNTQILRWYQFCCSIPLIGKWLFSWLVTFIAPYTGSIPFSVQELSNNGKCIISMRDSWLIRNPFRSIHAAALANLGEAATGMAMVAWMEAQTTKYRGIVTKLETVYYKKVFINF